VEIYFSTKLIEWISRFEHITRGVILRSISNGSYIFVFVLHFLEKFFSLYSFMNEVHLIYGFNNNIYFIVLFIYLLLVFNYTFL
jgi:hypothetical protein